MGLNVTDVGLNQREERELKKHAATIHCSNTLSLLQRKISNALLYHAYKELMLKEEHEITVKQLCQLIAYQGHNHAAIREALKGLLSTVIEWNVVDDSTGVEDWTASSIIASVSLQGPLCLYAYSPRMKQLLHSPSMFGKVNLVIQSRFKSNYGLALYENCIRYRGLPYTKWFDIETFRKLMGVPEDKYTIFRDFKKRVLDKSIEEVNMYSDLVVECELGREGRQVTKIRFSLSDREKKVRLGGNKQAGIEYAEQGQSEQALKTKLTEHYGFSPQQAADVLSEYREDFVQEKMALIESSRNYRQGKVQSLTAYLMSALRNDFQAAKPSRENKLELVKQRKEETLERMRLKRKIEQIRSDYFLYRENTIDQLIQALTQQEKDHFTARFSDSAEFTIATILRLQKNKYTKETVLQSPQIKALMRQYALENLHHIKSSLLTLDQYIEKLSVEMKADWDKFQALPDNHLLKVTDVEIG